MKVEVHGGLEAVGADVWDDLLAGARLRSPFLSWTWQREWVRSFAAGRRLDVRRVVDASGFPVAVLPLYESSPGVMTLVGGAAVSDYLDLLVLAGREEEAWNALLASREERGNEEDDRGLRDAGATAPGARHRRDRSRPVRRLVHLQRHIHRQQRHIHLVGRHLLD